MASTYDKKFKTTETTKAGGAEVVSDPIELSPRTKNHILTVTTDNSLSGTVDIEMEMSPDGQNWCPAVSRTVSSEAASSTGDVIGNEESVKLTPDAGEFKNKHARGGLNFDVNGAVVTPDGSGARDLMHQHIETSKSFNYSQWFKTSEAPTTTYKPVLFRHGGYDNFENAKVIQTDSNTTTQNLTESRQVANVKYLPTTTGGTPAPGLYYQTAFTNNKGWFPTYDDSTRTGGTVHWWTQTDSAISFWHKGNNSQSASQVIMYQYFHDHGAPYGGTDSWEGKFLIYFKSGYLYIERANNDYFRSGSWTVGYKWFYVGGVSSTDWHHYVINIPQNASLMTAITNATVTIDGGATSHGSTGTSTGGHDPDSAALTITHAGVLSTPSSVSTHPGNWTSSSTYTADIDELSTWRKNLTSTEISEIYNSGSYLDVTTSSCSSYLERHIRFGDHSNDGTSLYDAVSDTSFLDSHNSTDLTASLGSSEDIYYAGLGESADLFTTTSNLSISGWFKTTDTGTLFSNTGGAAATGMKMEVNASDMTFSTLDTATSLTISSDVDDGEWHHIVFTKPTGTNPNLKVYIDGALSASGIPGSALSNDDFRGSNGFTLLGDGQENAVSTSPAATDASKLAASISNWSLHSEILDENAVKQLYSNGHVRNIKNLPDVTASSINAWWQLDDVTTPEQDLIGSNDLQYQDGASAALTTKVVTATGATLVEDSINGNAMTMSLTKSFNFTTNEWVTTADQDTALCLSFNGFEEQAEYFAIWKCSQTIGGTAIDICDGDWHNVILSYRGRNDLAGDNVSEGDTVKFGPGPANTLPFNWAISYDGEPLTAIKDGSGADYIGGLNTLVTDTYNTISYNVGFNINNRHLKYVTSNTEEVYKPHAQFSAGIHEASGVDNINAFQGYVDETSFHSDTWWVDQAGTSVRPAIFNNEKPATIYGNTTALSNRGAATEYPVGVPYPLLNPEKLNTSGQASDIEGTNQYINPNRYDASTNPNGGLEGWWRWGDTPGDCSITINDVKDHNDSINARDIDASNIVTGDRQVMTSADSIYNANTTASVGGGTTITFPQVKIEGISSTVCNLANINSPLLQFIRVKWKGAGSVDLGEGKGEARLNYTNRRRRRKK